jgi:uncharacterized membrane protein YebE (DUF533 family)
MRLPAPWLTPLKLVRRVGLRVLVLALVLLPAGVAFARAGGGQHYSAPAPSYHGSYQSSGGYHGYNGNGGGVDLGYLLFWVLRLTIAYPFVMVPFWLVVAFVIYRASQSRASVTMPREIARLEERRLVPSQDVSAAVEGLQRQDPSFDQDAFFERTRKVFLEIQEAWFLRNLDSVRRYMSDGLYRRFTTLLTLMALEKQRNGLADATVMSARLVEVTRTDAFDCLTVRIHASMRDVDVSASDSDETARAKAKAASADEFSELWTFVRRRGLKTRPEFDASQGKCPNCGAPFSGGAANKCEYCNAIVNSGNYDWVLAEITQPSEYLPHDRGAPGLAALQVHDPDAAAELLQDRALLLFWKWLEAWALCDVRPLQKLALPEAASAIGEDIERTRQRGNFVVRLPAVGGTRVAAVETAQDGLDRAHIEVRWSAILAAGSASTFAHPQPHRSIVTMVRSTDARTDRGTGLSNERCGNCRAPLSDSDSTRCEFCGNDLTSAAKEWQLESLVPWEQWERPSVAPPPSAAAFATGGERLRLLRVLVAIVKADGIVEPRELRMLRDCAQRWQVPWPQVQAMLDQGVDETFGYLQPRSPSEAQAFLEQMVLAAKIDGRVDRRERVLIFRAAERLGVDAQTVAELIDE